MKDRRLMCEEACSAFKQSIGDCVCLTIFYQKTREYHEAKIFSIDYGISKNHKVNVADQKKITVERKVMDSMYRLTNEELISLSLQDMIYYENLMSHVISFNNLFAAHRDVFRALFVFISIRRER